MILRIVNLIVIGMFVLAAAYVYRIKFDSTVQAEQVAKLGDAVRHERDSIASLRAEWGELDNPIRIEALAKRFLKLQSIEPTQFDTFDHLPDRPPDYTDSKDPIGGMIESLEGPAAVTGSITAPHAAAAADPGAPAPSVPSPAPQPAHNPAPLGAPRQ
jgi:hypothetical protein